MFFWVINYYVHLEYSPQNNWESFAVMIELRAIVPAVSFSAESPSPCLKIPVVVAPSTGISAFTMYENPVAKSSQSSVPSNNTDSLERSTWSPTPSSTVYSPEIVYYQNIAND